MFCFIHSVLSFFLFHSSLRGTTTEIYKLISAVKLSTKHTSECKASEESCRTECPQWYSHIASSILGVITSPCNDKSLIAWFFSQQCFSNPRWPKFAKVDVKLGNTVCQTVHVLHSYVRKNYIDTTMGRIMWIMRITPL